MMTKVDQLESRRATAPILSQRAPSTAYPHSSEGGNGAEETTANTRRQYRHRRRRWTTEKVSESQNLDVRSQTPVSYVNSSEPHNRASTAVEPPKITPVEGPTPPPWEESKLRAVTHGAVEDNNVGVDDHGDQSTAPSIDSHGTWGSELMALSGVDIKGCESARVVDGKFDFKIVHGRATESIKSGDGADGDQDGQMSPSLSFSSLALEDSSRASMPGESNDEGSTEKTVENIASPEMVVRLCGSEREHEHSQPLESEAAAAPVMPGRTTTGKNTTSERKDGTLGCTASRQLKKANTCVLGVFDETQQTLGFGSELPRPQPQLYDIWIPRQYFQGKALTPATRKNENKEVNVPAASARVQKKIRSAIEVASMAVSEAASPNHSDVRESTSRGGSGNVDCGNRHESQDCARDAGNGDEANSPALERPVPPAVPTTARETCGDKNGPWSPSTRSVADGKVEVEVPDKDADLAPSAPSLHLNVAFMENEQCVKEKRQGYEFGSDGCSGLGDRDGNGRGGRSANDSAGGDNVRGVGGGFFDFATKFSWRTAANTTRKMTRDGEASRKELNDDEVRNCGIDLWVREPQNYRCFTRNSTILRYRFFSVIDD